MNEKGNRVERISPAFRQLRDYATAGYHGTELEIQFPRIDDLWNKLSEEEQGKYRQLLLKRERDLTSLKESENLTTESDKTNCTTALKVIELLRRRIDALQPPQFDT